MIGKDRTGKFHPPKGKPSGSPKKNSEVLRKKDIVDEAVSAETNPADLEDIHVRHQNRHTEKDQESKAAGE